MNAYSCAEKQEKNPSKKFAVVGKEQKIEVLVERETGFQKNNYKSNPQITLQIEKENSTMIETEKNT